MANYKPGTARMMKYLQEMSREDYEKMEKDICRGQKQSNDEEKWVIFVNDAEAQKLMELEMTSNHKRRKNIVMLEPLKAGLKKGELAKGCYNTSPQQLAMIVKEGDAHRPNQDQVISAGLLANPPLKPENVDHALMELELPGLYTEIDVDCVKDDKRINHRNYVLRKILKYGQDHPKGEWEWWLSFAWAVLDHLGLKQLNDVTYTGKGLSDEEKKLAEGWLAEAEEKIVKVNCMALRRHWVDVFKKNNGMSTEEGVDDLKAVRMIARKAFTGESSAKTQLLSDGYRQGARGSRLGVAQMAAAMGCDVDDINQLLRQVNYAELYPMQEDNMDRFVIRMTQENSAKAVRKDAEE